MINFYFIIFSILVLNTISVAIVQFIVIGIGFINYSWINQINKVELMQYDKKYFAGLRICAPNSTRCEWKGF